MIDALPEDPNSDPHKLRSMEFVEEAIDMEVKEIKQRQHEKRVRCLTDVSLMLLMILVTVLASLWLI